MLPGQSYSPEDILQILRKRVWWLLVPTALAAAATSVYTMRQPSLYRSDALIQVKPPDVSDAMVRSSVNTRISDRLQAVRQQVLGRLTLEQLINEFDLYPALRRTGLLQDAINALQSRIDVQAVRGDAFRVSFVHSDPVVAKEINTRIADRFMQLFEDERDRTAIGTSDFLQVQLDEARRQLNDMNERVAEYRRDNRLELPEQLNANMAALSNLNIQIRSTQDSIQNDEAQQLVLRQQLSEWEAQAPIRGTAPLGVPTPPRTPAAIALEAARANLAALRARGYRDIHPDVQAEEQRIRDLTAQVEAEVLATPLSAAGTAGLPQEELDRLKRISDLKAQLSQLADNLTRKTADLERFKTDAEIYQRRVDNTPLRQTELTDLMRDTGTFNDRYNSLLNRREDARISAESEEAGVNFQMVDPPSLPQRPFSPNKPRMMLMGIGVGMAFGAALVLLFEYRDRSFRLDSDVTRLLDLPVLAVVPLMESDADRRRTVIRRWLGHAGLGSVVLACCAIVVYTMGS